MQALIDNFFFTSSHYARSHPSAIAEIEELKTFPLHSVDSQLLFQEHEPLDGTVVEALVRESAEMLGLHPDGSQLLSRSTDHDLQMICGNLKVLVTQSLPLKQKEHLRESAKFQIAQNAIEKGLDLIENSNAVTSISVRKGLLSDIEFPDGMKRLLGPEVQCFNNAKETETAMNLAKVVSVKLLLKTPVSAVFWAPTRYFLPPQTFSELATMNDPVMLYVRPHVYSPIQEVSDKRLIGVSAEGSEHLLGYRVGFEPSSLPPAFMVERLMTFVSFCRKRGSVLPDGDVFGRNEDEKIRLEYKSTGEDEPDKIALSVQSSAELGITGDAKPTIYHQYNEDGERLSSTVSDVDVSDLDPDDPVDAAILERLAELKSASNREPSQTPAGAEPDTKQSKPSTSSPADEMPPVSKTRHNAQPASQRTSMDELRRFARQSQVPEKETPQRKDKKGLIARLFGKKTG